MIIKSNGWVFQVFPAENRKHYARELADHCTCAWCRNFYETVDETYPELRPFLEQFCVHIEAPDEMMSFTPVLCDCYYAVCGEILERGADEFLIGNVTVTPQSMDDFVPNTAMKEPCFFLRVGHLMLPWVQKEPMDEADSPAKGKNWIQKLLQPWISD